MIGHFGRYQLLVIIDALQDPLGIEGCVKMISEAPGKILLIPFIGEQLTKRPFFLA